MKKQGYLCIITVIAATLTTVTLLVTARVAQADGPIYVDRDAPGPTRDGLSWTTAYTTVQAALDAATYGDEIWVAQGVYTPTNTTEETAAFSLRSGVAVYGGFDGGETSRDQRDWQTHVTVLSGDIDGNDVTDANGVSTHWSHIHGVNVYNVVVASGTDDNTILDGFSITGGRARGPYWISRSETGGGMYISGGSPTLRNLSFSGNHANDYGGGMYTTNSSPTLTNVTFSGNLMDGATGGIYGGGGMCVGSGNPTLIDVVFSGNATGDWGYGGGMFIRAGDPTLINVSFSGNQAKYGGGIYDGGGSSTLVNVVFSGNSAETFGGGVYTDDSSPVLINVTISGNRATDPFSNAGGGMLVKHGSPTLINTILWGNTAMSSAQMAFVQGSRSVTINHSLLQPQDNDVCSVEGVTCGQIIVEDPQFGSGLRLSDSSPAIDAGDNNAVPADTHDLDGDGNIVEPLPYDRAGDWRLVEHPQTDTGAGTAPLVDIGAYERSVLGLAKTADPAVLEPGDPLTFTLTFKNDSTYTVTEPLIFDTIPAHAYNLDFDSSGVQVTPTGSISYTWQVEDLAPGARGAITVNGILSASLLPGRSFANVAVFSGAIDDLRLENTASATVARHGADLAVGKRAAPDLVVVGERLTYTLTITNHGLFDSIGIVLTDTLPGDVAFVSTSPDCNAATSHTITCTLGKLKNQATAAFTVVVTAPATVGTITNVVTVTAATPDPDPVNSTATEITHVSAEADLSITKSDYPDAVLAGGLLTYTLVVTNNGRDFAGGVVISDPLPVGTYFGGRLLSLPMNEAPGAENFADLSGFGHHGTCSQYYGTCPEAGVRGLYDYVLSFDGKDDWVESADFDIGNDFSISLWVYPLGDADGQAFISKHTSGGGSLFILGYFNDGYYVNLRGSSHQAGTKADDDWQHLAVVGQETGPSTTAITVYRDGQPLWQHDFPTVVGDMSGKGWAIGQEWDGDSESDFFHGAIDEVSIYNRALSVSEVAALYQSHPTVHPVVSRGTCALSGGLTCDLGSLAPYATVTLTFPVQVVPTGTGTLINTATVNGYVPDPLLSNNAAIETTAVSEIDLALYKTAKARFPVEGDAINYTIKLINQGPVTATTIVVRDALPGGIDLGGYAASRGVYDDTFGLWQVDTLAAGDVATLTITGTVGAGTTGQVITNTAELNASSPADLLTHNNASSAVITVASADLTLSKTVDTGGPDVVPLGDVVTYTIVFGNDGGDVATNVVMTDPLPSSVSYGRQIQGTESLTLSNNTVRWGPRDIAAHTVYTVGFTAIVTEDAGFSGKRVVNTANLAATNADPSVDSASFVIKGSSIYLPLVLKN